MLRGLVIEWGLPVRAAFPGAEEPGESDGWEVSEYSDAFRRAQTGGTAPPISTVSERLWH